MKHARADYNRIQDPAGLIPEDEPVFLLRAQDKFAPETLRWWIFEAEQHSVDQAMIDLATKQANKMEAWQTEHGSKIPDLPQGETT